MHPAYSIRPGSKHSVTAALQKPRLVLIPWISVSFWFCVIFRCFVGLLDWTWSWEASKMQAGLKDRFTQAHQLWIWAPLHRYYHLCFRNWPEPQSLVHSLPMLPGLSVPRCLMLLQLSSLVGVWDPVPLIHCRSWTAEEQRPHYSEMNWKHVGLLN